MRLMICIPQVIQGNVVIHDHPFVTLIVRDVATLRCHEHEDDACVLEQ
jgi:hypothetical protein